MQSIAEEADRERQQSHPYPLIPISGALVDADNDLIEVPSARVSQQAPSEAMMQRAMSAMSDTESENVRREALQYLETYRMRLKKVGKNPF